MIYAIHNEGQKKQFLKIAESVKLAGATIEFISDNKRLNSVFSDSIDSTGVVIVETSLLWNNKDGADFYGFDIAADLRRIYSLKNPIIFYSTFSRSYFERLSTEDKRYKLIYGRGSGFLHYPFSAEDVEQIVLHTAPLTNGSLHDVVTMLCNLKGIVIDKLNHELKIGSDVRQVVDSVSRYLTMLQRNLIDLEPTTCLLTEYNSIETRELFLSTKQAFIAKCYFHLGGENLNESPTYKKKYRVLVLDDRQEELDLIKQHLGEYFEFIYTTQGEHALNKLGQDVYNEILAVICDWRLYTDNRQNYWQALQGYEVLEYAAKNGLRALIALTSQSDFIVHQIRNIQNIRFQLFKKESLQSNEQWKLFGDILYEACVDTLETLTNLPSSKLWNNPLRDGKNMGTTLQKEYIKMRNEAPDTFDRINDEVDSLYKEIETYISSGMSNRLGEISTKKITQESLIQVLIQRRIWIALYRRSFDPIKIYNIMEAYSQYDPGKNTINQHKNKLCIVENDIKNNRILPEERRWLQKWDLI